MVFTYGNIACDLPLFCGGIPDGLPLGYGFFIDGEAMAVGSGETGKGDGAMTETTLDLDSGLLFLIDRDDDGIVVQDLACACGRLEVIAFGFAMHGLPRVR